MRIKDKSILLTGATGGIGRLVAQKLHATGVHLILSCYVSDSLEELITDLGGNHTGVCADISTEEGRLAILESCIENGGVDGVVNLAGILDFNLFENQSEVLLERMIAINLIAPILLTRKLLPLLQEREESVVLNVGSIFGSIGHPGFSAYCATKSGLMRFSEALSRELADTRVRIAYIAPRATQTRLNDDRVNDMNEELGNKSDTPSYVAEEIIAMLESKAAVRYLGWPEKLFVMLNALLPAAVGSALTKNLSTIRRFAERQRN